LKTAVYWSGGKDCTLALIEALATGISIDYLVTFIGEDTEFLCHPICVMEEQARQLGIPHIFHVIRAPYMASYAQAVCQLKREYRITSVITGDLIEAGSEKYEHYWLNIFCEQAEVKLSCPMGNVPRDELLRRILHQGLHTQVTGVRTGVLPTELLWKRITTDEIDFITRLGKVIDGFDLGGENGEYHTTVLGCEYFDVPRPKLETEVKTCFEVSYVPLLRPIGALTRKIALVKTT
jgi:diphthamide synthase (EF-2-diphthine--ammonia ligase)